MSQAETASFVFVQVIERPARKLLLKRGLRATHYFEYCEEVGCDVWSVLASVKEALYEPVGLWLPDRLITPGTSRYVQGVELELDYNELAPAGFEVVVLEPCKMMVFQGEPYDDACYREAIAKLQRAIATFRPEVHGYLYDESNHPRLQLAPTGRRGYIEAVPVKSSSEKSTGLFK